MACNEWLQLDNKWYRLDKEGHMIIGWWQDENGIWYYFEENSNGNKGVMYQNGFYSISGVNYTFDSEGNYIELASNNIVNFIKEYEQFYPNKYDDGTGTITQGYGATGNEIEQWGDTITEGEATNELNNSLKNNYSKLIMSDLNTKNIILSQSQFDSLVSFAYNCGVNNLLNSTLYNYIISGGRNKDKITAYFRMWNKVNGEVWGGLDKRRISESNIFNNNVYDSTH
jgi:lysozyme